MLSPRTLAYQAILAIALAISPASPLLSATPEYTVEVIVFKNLTGNPAGAEIWTRTNQEPLPEEDLELDLPDDVASPNARQEAVEYTRLKASDLSLGGLAKKLRASSRYEVLLHQGWRQPGLDRGKAAPMRIEVALDGGRQPVRSGTDGWSNPRARLEGELKLILSRYLHLETDLRYYTGEVLQPLDAIQDEFAELVTQPLVYRMKQGRRMRSGELHYIDHPGFGLLAVVKPYEP